MTAGFARVLPINPAQVPDGQILFGKTAAMQAAREAINRAIDANLSVILEGEHGTGRETVAKAIHCWSGSAGQPFIKIDGAGFAADGTKLSWIPDAPGRLIPTAELYGLGVDPAHTGTLFFQDMQSSALQREIAFALEWRATQLQGGARTAPVRIVVAIDAEEDSGNELRSSVWDTNRNSGAIIVRLCALRDRKEDLPELCEFFARKLAAHFGKRQPDLTPETMRALKQWDWPGNLRELENWIARVLILGTQEALVDEFLKRNNGDPSLEFRHRQVAWENDSAGAPSFPPERWTAPPGGRRWGRRGLPGHLKISSRKASRLDQHTTPRRRKH